MEKTLKVSGMHCKSCEILLGEVLSEIKGITKAKANSAKGTVSLEYTSKDSLDSAMKAIEKEGYKVVG